MTSINAAQSSAATSATVAIRGSAGSAQTNSQPAAATAKPGPASTVVATVVSLSATATAATTAAKEPSMGKKDFATVAKDARASLDTAFEKMGRTADNHTTDAEWKTAVAGLDRRALYAIASNQGGNFSDLEQGLAKYTMSKQVDAAMGLDNLAAAANQNSAMSKSEIQFLEGVSDEEKTSIDWAKRRASSQFTYDFLSEREGKEPENLDSENPIVKLIKGGLDRLRQSGDSSQQLEDTPQYKQAVQLSEQLKAANAPNPSATSGHKIDITA
ncbi:hypothetical protein [Azospirillum doebereinerae]|uniref:Uncharacterized protein n=1 Tax=Azospirillum doebereinerae TaxID=92933 RepID=A0A3S1CHE2_9PROT|nr:hypothetical protein [Azospirillum doebereinerae]RUQ72038.1 hypothetical protein EJ913_10700 [Azospirillum doebereinerae]